MASKYQVLCINKNDRNSAHEKISHIGGKNADGTNWKVTQEAAIKGIESGKWEFYVSVNGKTATVIVINSIHGKYIRTKKDSTEVDNLLSLPECI